MISLTGAYAHSVIWNKLQQQSYYWFFNVSLLNKISSSKLVLGVVTVTFLTSSALIFFLINCSVLSNYPLLWTFASAAFINLKYIRLKHMKHFKALRLRLGFKKGNECQIIQDLWMYFLWAIQSEFTTGGTLVCSMVALMFGCQSTDWFTSTVDYRGFYSGKTK